MKDCNPVNYNAVIYEQCIRLGEILRFIFTDNHLGDMLVMKGGSVINLCYLDVPRVSSDIDVDFSYDFRDEQFHEVQDILTRKFTQFSMNKYSLVSEQKGIRHRESFIFNFSNDFGEKDCISIDVNYKKRIHILPYQELLISNSIIKNIKVNSLNVNEVLGGKIKVLLERFHAKDYYDIYNMLNENIELDLEMIKKSVIFYNVATGKCDIDSISLSYDSLSYTRINELINMLPETRDINMDRVVRCVYEFLCEILMIGKDELLFVHNFKKGRYLPELLFEPFVANRLKSYPIK